MDEELEARFRDLRAHERAEAPGLDDVLARTRPAGHERPGRRRLHSALLAAACAAAILAVLLRPRDARRVPDDLAHAGILQWRAPTDVLLQTPSSELLSELPSLDHSIIDPEGHDD